MKKSWKLDQNLTRATAVTNLSINDSFDKFRRKWIFDQVIFMSNTFAPSWRIIHQKFPNSSASYKILFSEMERFHQFKISDSPLIKLKVYLLVFEIRYLLKGYYICLKSRMIGLPGDTVIWSNFIGRSDHRNIFEWKAWKSSWIFFNSSNYLAWTFIFVPSFFVKT